MNMYEYVTCNRIYTKLSATDSTHEFGGAYSPMCHSTGQNTPTLKLNKVVESFHVSPRLYPFVTC